VNKWQDDTEFKNWLLENNYATETAKEIKPRLSLGLVLYCFEAFTEGKKQGQKKGA
tara:strand:- start:794 stop:961 length:168 start_codon:yes stop_codon:yes gene_type:complete